MEQPSSFQPIKGLGAVSLQVTNRFPCQVFKQVLGLGEQVAPALLRADFLQHDRRGRVLCLQRQLGRWSDRGQENQLLKPSSNLSFCHPLQRQRPPIKRMQPPLGLLHRRRAVDGGEASEDAPLHLVAPAVQ